MAADGTSADKRPADLQLDLDSTHEEDNEIKESFQGPHDWRKRLRPVQSPIKCDTPELQEQDLNGPDKENQEKQKEKGRPLPPWKRDLIEKNKKVARLVRRESSGRSNRNPVIRRESSGRSKRAPGSESPSGIQRKKSFQKGSESSFTQQVVNENTGFYMKKRVSPANSFRAATSTNVRRTPSDKAVDPNDPNTKRRIERVRKARLYLLQQLGPNSFLIVGDSPEHKFKVIIGQQTCSCGKSPHCVHVLFVMLRVFQVVETDPCLWSKNLKNYEVENLFRVYNDRRSSRIRKERLVKSRKLSPNTSSNSSPEQSAAPSESDAGSVREEDDTCPICLLEMVEGESLLKCEGCANRLHHHCVTVWFEECRRQNDTLICPLCRARWKNSNVEVKTEEAAIEPTLAPPNTRAPSPQHDTDNARLPYAEPIPTEHADMAAPWIEILGADLVACLFSRNWSIRETGLKHFGKEVISVLQRGGGEGLSSSSATSPRQAAVSGMLQCCSGVLAFMCADPVYKVFVGCLKVLRTVLSHTQCKDDEQKVRLQTLFKPVVDAVMVKCTDGNRRMGQLSLSTTIELAKGQHGELAVGRDVQTSGNLGSIGLGGMTFLVRCATEKYVAEEITWQWLLGRLYVIEKLLLEFPSEFVPRLSPDGASSESSLEALGAACPDDDDKPLNYERLLTIAEFAVQAVPNNHARVSRMAKRVFLLATRFSAHVETLISELDQLLNTLDFVHRKSLKRQFDKIVQDFHISERIVQELQMSSAGQEFSPLVTPTETPLSTPRCNSPVTVTSTSDYQSEAGSSTAGKAPLPAPPNTPIRDRRSQLKSSGNNRTFDYLEEESSDGESLGSTQKLSKSLDSLDCIEKPKFASSRRRLVKSPVVKKGKSRSRSGTPQRKGPVLETNLDDVIRQQEEIQKSGSDSKSQDSVGREVPGHSSLLTPPYTPEHTLSRVPPPSLPVSPPPILLSSEEDSFIEADIETDIDTGEVIMDFSLSERKLIGGDLSIIQERSLETKDLDLSNCDTSSTKHSTPFTSKSCSPPSFSVNSVRHKSLENASASASLLDSVERCTTPDSQMASSSRKLFHPSASCSKLSDKGARLSLSAVSFNQSCGSKSCSPSIQTSSRTPSANQSCSPMSDDLLELSPITAIPANEKPVTFQSEVAMATPKNSPSQTLDKDEEDCFCKEEVEKEEALALAKAMEVSAADPPKPVVPGLTPIDQEQVITIQIQPDEFSKTDDNGNPPMLYLENLHWQKGPLLGTGAFSTCYQARDVKTGILMACKQISYCRNSRSEQESVIESITEEIHMMAKLKHPNVVRIMGATRQGCHFNMFIEWMAGGSVSYLLGHYGPFIEDVMTNYSLQILRGLAYLHDNHLLHRDLKGANLLVDSTAQRLRIGDFGAAARLASRQTGAGEFQGQLLGTIAFMAPEVLRGENYGRACDVWSVGCCMIEMATTKPPWNAHDISNHLALIFKIANASSTPPIPEKLSPPVRDLMLRCLEPDKEQRPAAKDLLIHPLFTQYMKRR